MMKLIICGLLALTSLSRATSSKPSKPNVIVIMADDQDMLLDSLSVQPSVKSLIADKGVLYQKHYCTVAWCCPSRVNYLTGKAAHNTNITALSPPYGGWPKFVDEKLNENWLPIWINESGIRTYYAGKLMNSYNIHNFDQPHPKGWTESSFLVDPYTYNYFHSHWTNGYTSKITPFDNIHTTNVTQQKALDMIDDAAKAGEQFFMQIAPVAPHVQLANGSASAPPAPEEFKGMYSDRVSPRVPNWNPDTPSGASWVYALPKLDADDVAFGDMHHVHRLENEAGIDSMVAALIQRLQDHKLLDNTYIIYTSDNGFHIGNHRMTPGKRCGYETDINIPLLIRGPDVAKGVVTNVTNSHTDMAPTILQMLGVPTRPDFDGKPIAYTASDLSAPAKNEYVNVEFWNAKEDDEVAKPGSYYNNTYASVRLQTADQSFYYSVWCTHEHEFYDMKAYYYQMDNLLRGPHAQTQYYGRPSSELVARLDTMLLVLKSCKMDSCRNPWGVLFPKGQVTSIEDAMDQKYDNFFAKQPQVSFKECIPGHIISLEGPQNANVYTGS